jgi:hypothetical protein
MRAGIEALQAMGGMAPLSAATIVSDAGSLPRFPTRRQLKGVQGRGGE